MGSNSGGTESNRFVGKIDDVRIYDRALWNNEVARLAGSAVPAPSSVIALLDIGLMGVIRLVRRGRVSHSES